MLRIFTIHIPHLILAGLVLAWCSFGFPPPVLPATTNSVILEWLPNQEPHLAGYKVYHGTESGIYGNPQPVGNNTTYQYTNLEPNKTHFFALTAYDALGNESPPTPEVSIHIPATPSNDTPPMNDSPPTNDIPPNFPSGMEDTSPTTPDVEPSEEPSTGHPVTFEEIQTGASARNLTVATTGPLTAVPQHLYLASIATKPYRPVNSVSGLGLSWFRVDEQCAGRKQTGVEIWAAHGTSPHDGPVTARLFKKPKNTVIAVSRYAGVDLLNPVGNVVSGNTNGLEGTCSREKNRRKDQNFYAVDLMTTAPGSVVFGAIAMRHRTHAPMPGFAQRGIVRQGRGGEVASVLIEDQRVASKSNVTLGGQFSGKVDWAAIGVEIRGRKEMPMIVNVPE